MSIATLIRRMTDAGAPPEAIAIAVEEIEAIQACLDARRAADRDRKREQRERQKQANVTGQSEYGHGTVTPISLSPLVHPKKDPEPQKIHPPISPKPTTELRARRLPSDWEPEPVIGKAGDMIAAWSAGELERELAKFKNYWLAKGGKDACKTNWQRTWINWLISADERKPRNVSTTGTDSLTAIALGKIGALHH